MLPDPASEAAVVDCGLDTDGEGWLISPSRSIVLLARPLVADDDPVARVPELGAANPPADESEPMELRLVMAGKDRLPWDGNWPESCARWRAIN